MSKETVDHPDHYLGIPARCDVCGDLLECIEIVRHMNFNLGNVFKYIWRAGVKTEDAIEDLKKARWYLDDEIKRLEKQKRIDKNVKILMEYRDES